MLVKSIVLVPTVAFIGTSTTCMLALQFYLHYVTETGSKYITTPQNKVGTRHQRTYTYQQPGVCTNSSNTTTTSLPADTTWPPSQEDTWKPVIADSDVIFVFSAFLSPAKHAVVISALTRNISSLPGAFFCQLWATADGGQIQTSVVNASLAISGEFYKQQ